MAVCMARSEMNQTTSAQMVAFPLARSARTLLISVPSLRGEALRLSPP
jgi:hypothetical protein